MRSLNGRVSRLLAQARQVQTAAPITEAAARAFLAEFDASPMAAWGFCSNLAAYAAARWPEGSPGSRWRSANFDLWWSGLGPRPVPTDWDGALRQVTLMERVNAAATPMQESALDGLDGLLWGVRREGHPIDPYPNADDVWKWPVSDDPLTQWVRRDFLPEAREEIERSPLLSRKYSLLLAGH